jgi:flagellar assembly factor FliW
VEIATKLQNENTPVDSIEKLDLFFPHGIVGFPDSRNFELVVDPQFFPFIKLNSLDEENLSFILLDPWVAKEDYQFKLPDSEVETLELKNENDIMIYSIIILDYNNNQMVMNLMAPVIVNRISKKGIQLILEEPELLHVVVNI